MRTSTACKLCVVAIVLAMSLADARRGDDRAAAPEKESNVDDIVSQGEASLLQVQAKKGLHSVVGDGTRRKETEHFYTYMSRWWRLHRAYMQQHNSRLYEKLREHRALSMAKLWKPFLLRWHYVQPRLLQGYRYTWNDDGSYTTKRFLMKSTKRVNQQIVSARIRSVNNVCFPGLLPPKRRKLWCTYDKRVSCRAVQFTLEHGHLQAPVLSVLRAYTSFVPKQGTYVPHETANKWMRAKPAVRFVSVQGLHWSIHEMIEYCDEPSPSSGAKVPRAYEPKRRPLKRAYSLEFMEWNPIKMARSQLDNGATVESVELKSKDEKIRIVCVVPVKNPQNIDGSEIRLTQQKCSFYIRQWDFNLACPKGTKESLALKTTVKARDDSGEGSGQPTLTPSFKTQVTRNHNKISMEFEQQAVLHVHSKEAKTDTRSSVPVVMTQSENMQWTADPRFKSSRNMYFSFIVADIKQVKKGVLHWDPDMSGHFRDKVTALKGTGPSGHRETLDKPDVVMGSVGQASPNQENLLQIPSSVGPGLSPPWSLWAAIAAFVVLAW